MKLIGSNTSPYVRKVRAVMSEKKLEYSFVQEDVWAFNSSISESNPLGKVPCLIMEGQDPVFDSRVIVEYLDGLSPVGKLIPTKGRERVEVKTWEALADGILDAAILARLEATWPGRSAEQRSPAWIERQLIKVEKSVLAMEKSIGDKQFCCGIYFTLADIATGCALSYLDFRFPELNWRQYAPRLNQLMSKLEQRPCFIDTHPL